MQHPTESRGHVYCAGPLFNQSEREEMTAIADLLCQAGYTVYLPHRDGMEFRHVHASLINLGWDAATAGKFLHQAIFALDVYQLVDACGAVVWNLNGRVPDEGAVSEAAIAWTLGKPIVAYKEDVRSMIAGRDNPLLAGLVQFELITQMDQILPTLEREWARHAALSPIGPTRLMPHVLNAVHQGRDLWQAMRRMTSPEDNDSLAEVIEQLFSPGKLYSGDRTAAAAREEQRADPIAADGRALKGSPVDGVTLSHRNRTTTLTR